MPADFGTLDFCVKSEQISPNVRAALAKAAALKQQMTGYQREIDQLRAQSGQLVQDQARTRDNLNAVPERSPLQTRWLTKLEDLDKQIEAIYQKTRQAQDDHDRARKALEDHLSNLNIED